MLRCISRIAALLLLIAAARVSPLAQPVDLSRVRMVDLTHAFDSATLYWPTSPSGFELERLAFGRTVAAGLRSFRESRPRRTSAGAMG